MCWRHCTQNIKTLKTLCLLQVDNRDDKDRGDSGISRSTRSSSPPSRHASSKWAYRTINLHPDSETENSEPSPRRKISLPKLKQTPRKKKAKEMPIVRGIPRVIRRVNTETMLMAGKYYYVLFRSNIWQLKKWAFNKKTILRWNFGAMSLSNQNCCKLAITKKYSILTKWNAVEILPYSCCLDHILS